jgi:hypothetical protein
MGVADGVGRAFEASLLQLGELPRMRTGALGSLKITVPTWTALAPATMNSSAS